MTNMTNTSSRYDNGDYLLHNRDWHLSDSPWKASQISGLLDRHSVRFSSAVEVGCGAGGVAINLAKRYPQSSFVGYDTAKDARAFWNLSGQKNLEFRSEDFLESDELFDLLLLIDVFEHVPDYMGFLNRLRPRAKMFVFNIPLDMHVAGILTNNQTRAREAYGHLHYFSESTALATLKDCSFEIVGTQLAAGFQGVPKSSSRAATRQRIMYPLRKLATLFSPTAAAKLFGGYSLYVLAVPSSPSRFSFPSGDLCDESAPRQPPQETIDSGTQECCGTSLPGPTTSSPRSPRTYDSQAATGSWRRPLRCRLRVRDDTARQ